MRLEIGCIKFFGFFGTTPPVPRKQGNKGNTRRGGIIIPMRSDVWVLLFSERLLKVL
jgi:hypothetical protein